MSTDVLRFLAVWALVHEMADEGWKAAVARGGSAGPQGLAGGTDALADGLASMVAQEKERLKESLASGNPGEPAGPGAEALEELRFELGQVRARLESMEASIEAILERLGGTPEPAAG